VPAGWRPDGAREDDGRPAVELAAFAATLTGIAVAIAETGTLVLDGGPLSGRRAISLLPDCLVCVVEAGQVVGGVPEALPRLDPNAPLTMVSGPSATSDIELQRVEGVHGPRTLVVVLVA
jgi:L-lactate dehydrogenase complex protein LldG